MDDLQRAAITMVRELYGRVDTHDAIEELGLRVESDSEVSEDSDDCEDCEDSEEGTSSLACTTSTPTRSLAQAKRNRKYKLISTPKFVRNHWMFGQLDNSC